ncbi:HIT-like domain-containing protein [Umbelopsis sp. PMI_123]|nr:HIT-like domain-containing protein [Umbelopsis sp. PMI_123]
MQKLYNFGPHKLCESQVFYKSKFCIGLVNLKPITPGHVMVIPRRIVTRFADMTSDEATDMILSAQKIGNVIEKEYDGTSLTLVMQDGPQAGQTVPHVHIHIIPRKAGDWANNDDVYDELDGKRAAAGIKRVDNEERKPRTIDEMKEEAYRLRPLFDQFEE